MLEVINVSVSHKKLKVVKEANLRVSKHSFVAIIGPNGAGKSSLLDAIIGINCVTSGEIWFEGKNVTSQAPSYYVDSGIVSVAEGRKLFRNMTVEDNLMVGGYNKRAIKYIKLNLNQVYDLFPVLKRRMKQVANTLSGGELQMLAIGCGLMANPQLLILDEPSIGIAPILVNEIFEKLKRLNDQGLTILMAEQNVTGSMNFSKYTYVLENGHIALEGESEHLKSNDHIRECYLGIC
jgi:branched-chain amino acid transport system ATP-binding protein